LNGYMSIDERENKYSELTEFSQGKNEKRRKDDKGLGWMKNINEKIKGLLTDDLDDTMDY